MNATDTGRLKCWGSSSRPRARQYVGVAILDYVWFWPNGGFVDREWDPGSGPAADAFARTSRRVTERYSAALAEWKIEARQSTIQMAVSGTENNDQVVIVELHLRPLGEEHTRVFVPTCVADMLPQDRARLVLEVVGSAMMRIGRARGWPEGALANAYEQTLDHNLGFDMTGAWKSNRSRKRVARPVARIGDDGWGHLSFEVAESRSGDSLGFTRPVASPLNSLPKFKRAAREFRWLNETTIERPDDWQPRYPPAWGAVETVHADELQTWPRVVDPAPASSPLTVELRVLTQ